MNYEELQKLINGESVKVGNKNNQIYYDNGYFQVEFYEFTNEKEGEMFSVGDGFVNIEDAINLATKHTSESYTLSRWK